jgi:hypothetical protein
MFEDVSMRRIYLLPIAIFIVIAMALHFYFNGSAAHGVAQAAGTYPQDLCVNGMPINGTALGFAMGSGIRCFRTDITLSPEQISFAANATGSGAQFLGILDYDTVGAHPSQGGCLSGCNWTLADWNASVYNAVAAYPGVNEWEIYNEPLATLFMSGYDNGSALNYFNMIRSAYTIIKSKEPNATIVCFGGAELYPPQQVQYEYQFYDKVWQYGASRYCNAISIHAYSLPFYSLNQTIGGNITLGMYYAAVLGAYENMTGKPIWITETGITSNNWASGLNLSEYKQASFLSQDLSFFSHYSFVKRIYWFDFMDSPGGTQDYGLLNGSMHPKPAWYAFLRFVHNSTA